jgi:hypothetical protein
MRCWAGSGQRGRGSVRSGAGEVRYGVSLEFRSTSSLMVGHLLPVLLLRATLCLGALVFVAAPFHVQILATKQASIGKCLVQ